MKNTLWIVGVIIIIGLAWMAWGGTAPSANASWMDGEATFDLGDTEFTGGLIDTTLTFTHSGEEAVTITDIYSNCGCTEATVVHGPHTIGPFGMAGHGSSMSEAGGEALDWSIAPTDDFTVKITFDPATHGEESIGDRVERKVTIQTNKGDGVITFKAHIV